MTASPYFHIGILVPDLDEATERFSDVLGVTFVDRVYQDSEYFDDGGVIKNLRLHLTYSIDGPPYHELLEAQGTTACTRSTTAKACTTSESGKRTARRSARSSRARA